VHTKYVWWQGYFGSSFHLALGDAAVVVSEHQVAHELNEVCALLDKFPHRLLFSICASKCGFAWIVMSLLS
jgi:hypothetical protein